MNDEGYLVSARRWRPQRFEDLVGQEHVSRTLANAIRKGRVAHAFLFTGVRGVGKTTAARILAKALNCEHGPTPTPCNACTSCEEITAARAVDVLEIDGASNTSVDDVREIIENVPYRPARGRYKVYIIDEVHMLSNSAFNALLKTLEEPPPHVKFIFATTDPHKLPATVRSRCQRYDFRRIPLRLVVQRLREIVAAEQVEATDGALFALAREGEGSLRDAQSLLDQVLAFGETPITESLVVELLGIADRAAVRHIADAALDRDAARALKAVAEVHERGHDPKRLTRDLLGYVRDLAVAQITAGAVLPDLPEDELSSIRERAAALPQEDLQRAFRILEEADAEIGRSSVPKLVLDMAVARIAYLPPVVPVESLLERLENLERRLAGAPSGGRAPSARPRPSPAPVHVRERSAVVGGPVESGAQPEPPAPASNDGPLEWQGFVDFVQAEKPSLAFHLGRCRPGRWENGLLEIAAPEGFTADYLADPDHRAGLEELATRRAGRPLRVRIVAARADGGEGSKENRRSAPEKPRGGAEKRDLHEEAMRHPAVQAAVRILGGEIQAVRPHRGKPRAEET